MPTILGANTLSSGYNVANSLRFNYDSSDYLNKTLGTATNRKIFTISMWVKRSELEDLKNKALIINEHLVYLFSKINIELIDFKIEFGKTLSDNENKLILADEISPDNCRLWDKNTKKNFDKDIFRNNTGDLIEGYQEIVKRFEIKIES